VNVDLPHTASAYTHRIGRSSRGGASGQAVSLHNAADPTEVAVIEDIRAVQTEKFGVPVIAEYVLDLEKLEAFRYRVDDALRAITRKAIAAARADELRQDVLRSEKLQDYFARNPAEQAALRKAAVVRVDGSRGSKTIPDYLMPARSGAQAANAPINVRGTRTKRQQVKARKERAGQRKVDKRRQGKKRPGQKAGKDPLKV
jgi:ATP-dependent RNA helicase DDX56/DBP9